MVVVEVSGRGKRMVAVKRLGSGPENHAVELCKSGDLRKEVCDGADTTNWASRHVNNRNSASASQNPGLQNASIQTTLFVTLNWERCSGTLESAAMPWMSFSRPQSWTPATLTHTLDS